MAACSKCVTTWSSVNGTRRYSILLSPQDEDLVDGKGEYPEAVATDVPLGLLIPAQKNVSVNFFLLSDGAAGNIF